MRGCDEPRVRLLHQLREPERAWVSAANPYAAIVFFWHELERQVRVEGQVEKTSEAESDVYFHGRPEGARIGAWASNQSEVVPSREALEAQTREFERRSSDGEIPPGRRTGAAIA